MPRDHISHSSQPLFIHRNRQVMHSLPSRPACVVAALAGIPSSYDNYRSSAMDGPWHRLRARLVKETAEVVLIRRLSQTRARLAALERLSATIGTNLSYLYQGDEDMYTVMAMDARARVRTAPGVSSAIRALWNHATAHQAPGSKIVRRYLYSHHMRMCPVEMQEIEITYSRLIRIGGSPSVLITVEPPETQFIHIKFKPHLLVHDNDAIERCAPILLGGLSLSSHHRTLSVHLSHEFYTKMSVLHDKLRFADPGGATLLILLR